MTEPFPSDLSAYAGLCELRLVGVDMDGTLLDDQKRFPPKLDELLDELDSRGIVFAPASGRQVWTLLDMFPNRPGMTVIAENGAIVMKDGVEVSSSPLDHETVSRAIDLVRAEVKAGRNAGLLLCGKQFAYIERHDEPFTSQVDPYYHRVLKVSDQHEVVAKMESGAIDDDVIKLAVLDLEEVTPIAEKTLGLFAETHQFAISGLNWADLQLRGVDKGRALRALQEAIGVSPAQTAAFGDFHNDLSMLAQAEWSFAMANAHADVIEAARFVAPSNNEDGVGQVLRTLLNG